MKRVRQLRSEHLLSLPRGFYKRCDGVGFLRRPLVVRLFT